MPRPTPRAILEALPHQRLLDLARHVGVPAGATATTDVLVRVLGRLGRAELRRLLGHLDEDELHGLAYVLAVGDTSGLGKDGALDALLGPRHLRLVGAAGAAAADAPLSLTRRAAPVPKDRSLPPAEPAGPHDAAEPTAPAEPTDSAAPTTAPSAPSLDAEAEPAPTGRRRGARRTELGFEATLWRAADKLRNNMDAGEYKHVVLGLIFLKFISDAFDAADGDGAPDARPLQRPATFWVPPDARWPHLAARAHTAEIGALVDDAMRAVERSNPSLQGILPRNYERPDLDKQRLGELIDLVSTIGLGAPEDRSRDVLGRVYEYFLTSFAAAEGKNGGQFYTPRSVVRLLVEMLAPYKGTVYDPACGSGGLFVQSERFIEEHGGRPGDIAVYGQESNPTTWRLAKMNLALRGIPCDLGPEHADSFHRDLHRDLRADYVLANPPFNCRDWGRERLVDDPRWRYGLPPERSANFAWVQHFIHHLAPRGLAGFVLANGAMSSVTAGEGDIRRAIVEDDLVDCMVALPSKLFYSTQIPVSLWFLARDKADPRLRDRRGETLFIDARALGQMVDRVHRELADADIARLAGTYHAWRGDPGADAYADVAGFCRAVALPELRASAHTLVPGHYVGGAAPAPAGAGRPFVERFAPLAAEVERHLARARALEAEIRALLERLRR